MADLFAWTFDKDNDPADFSSTNLLSRHLMLNMANALLAIPGSSCLGSSDGSTAAIDGVNRWTDVSKVIWASSGAHSWIIIQSALGVNILLDLLSANIQYPCRFVFAKTAFTGGTTSARPTATDEWDYTPASANTLHDNTTTLHRMQMVYSNRGDFWLWHHKTGLADPASAPTYFIFGLTRLVPVYDVEGNVINDPYDVVSYIAAGASGGAVHNVPLIGVGSANSGFRGRTSYGSLVTLAGVTLTTAGTTYVLDTVPTSGGPATKGFPMMPLEVWYCQTGYGDRKGIVPDVKIGSWGLRPMAGNAPAGLVTRRSVGQLWLPGMNSDVAGY